MTTATMRLTRPVPSSDLDAVLANVDRHLGPGVATTLADSPPPVQTIPTGSLALNQALGVGGIPTGRITEIYGPEGAGKTTLALKGHSGTSSGDGMGWVGGVMISAHDHPCRRAPA
jgi:predicted ATP-dependent serine protease